MPKGKSTESGESKMKRISKEVEKKLTDIAKREFYGLEKRDNLRAHYSDDEDFIEVAVWCILSAMHKAYLAGKEDGKAAAMKK